MLASLGLKDNKAFAAFITDIFVNTSQSVKIGQNRKENSCLLLDRFVRLLSGLSGKTDCFDIEASVRELQQMFEPEAFTTEANNRDIHERLAQDSDFMTKVTVL